LEESPVNRVLLDDDTSRRLLTCGSTADLYDEDGHFLGGWVYRGIDPPSYPENARQRRELEQEYFTTDEALARLAASQREFEKHGIRPRKRPHVQSVALTNETSRRLLAAGPLADVCDPDGRVFGRFAVAGHGRRSEHELHD
jgi:hypothetical protein